MATLNSSPTPGASESAHTPPTHDRHHAMVVAEAARLERMLRSIGPMPVAKLADACGSTHWREGTFQEAVREGIRQGRVRRLPLEWLEAPLS